jgi:hypothetical protein
MPGVSTLRNTFGNAVLSGFGIRDTLAERGHQFLVSEDLFHLLVRDGELIYDVSEGGILQKVRDAASFPLRCAANEIVHFVI